MLRQYILALLGGAIIAISNGTPGPNSHRVDDGSGMDTSTLGTCLGVGFTTRTGRRGSGRFGVGLPQASLYACPEVIVYSWQNGIQNCQRVFLDIEKVKSGEQTEIADPVNEQILLQ